MKGLILAGGAGTRLYPATKTVSKQLLPVYDKPLIYYPLSTLMLADIREILIITTLEDNGNFMNLLGNGSHLGLELTYAIQKEPLGLPEAFIIGEQFIGEDRVCMILGDNIFYSDMFINNHVLPNFDHSKATVFTYRVRDPERYGIVEIDNEGCIVSIEEKPSAPKSNYAITGLYVFNNDVCQLARKLEFSQRGELEIVDLLKHYARKGQLKMESLGRGTAWLDTGTHQSLIEASNFIQVLENRQGLKVGCIEEIAFQKGWITREQLASLALPYLKNDYGKYLQGLAVNAP